MPKPYYKKSHKAWYVNIDGKPYRLGVNEAEAREIYERLRTGRYTVADIIDRFLKIKRKPATQKFYSLPLNKLKKSLGKQPAVDLKPYQIRGCRNNFRAAKTCFKWAEEQGYLTQSPLAGLKIAPASTRGDEVYLTPEQWYKFEQSLTGDLKDIAVSLRETGCRPKEAREVESRHFNREARCWIFPKLESKGGTTPRVVHLSDRVFEICQRRALKYPDGVIFRNGDKPWTAQALWKKFVPFGYTPYCLRHTFATEAIIRGVDLQTIAILMGHSNLKMLSRIYQHINCRSDFIKQGLRKAIG